MEFKGNKKPDHLASYLSDKADQEKRDELGAKGKKLTKKQRDQIGKDAKFTDKRKKFDSN